MLMIRLFTSLTLAAATLALGSCAASVETAEPRELTPDQLALLDRNLGGKEAGEPIRCLPAGSSQSLQTIRVSDDILLYRQSGRLVYRNDLRGGCPGLSRDSDILVFRNSGGATCRGDIFTLVDRNSGIRGGACVLGDFTPYRAPRN
jgi:hypothetical protein